MLCGNKKDIKKILLVRPVSEVVNITGHIRDIRVLFLLKYIESLLAQEGGFQTYFLDCMLENIHFDKLVNFSIEYCPDMVVISSTTLEYDLTLEYAGLLKEKFNIPIVAVGQDATASPERYVYNGSAIDIVLRGECEFSFLELLRAINKNEDFSKIKGIFMRGYGNPDLPIVQELDSLPFPLYNNDKHFRKYKIYYPLPISKKIIWGHVLSSRGCPYNCIFCSQTIRESYGKEIRLRKPSNVVDEIEYLQYKGANAIAFADDNFTTKRNHVMGICEEIKRRRLNIIWSAHARVDNCDEKLLNLMKGAGCVLLRFGVESGSQKIIKRLRKTDMIEWIDKAKDVFKIARRINLSTVALFLIGNPSETYEDVEKSISLAKELKPAMIQICFFTPYPGSSAYEEFKDEIGSLDIKGMYHYRLSTLNFSQIRKEELKNLYKRFYREFLLRVSYIFYHIYSYSMFYIHNKDVFFKLFNMRKIIFD